MADTEKRVAAHYDTGDLLGRIRAALAEAGADLDRPSPQDLKGVDEFHTGGLQATEDFLAQLEIDAGTRVLDIGCGIGGTSRHVALESGASVTGVDLTPLYVETARKLSDLVGLGDRTRFLQGSAIDLPVESGAFDLALMLHVGMNVEDKGRLMAEAARALAPGGTFALFDVMRVGEGELTFPYPWAEEAAFSFVAPPETYRDAAARAGLDQVAERARADFALAFFEKVFAAIRERGGPPPVGIHLLMRDTAAQKIQNYVAAVQGGLIAPVEMIFRKAAP